MRYAIKKWLCALAVCCLIPTLGAVMTVSASAAERTGNDWILPVSNYTSFGCSYGCKCEGGHDALSAGHKGYDVRANNDNPVLATRGGKVISVSKSCKGSHFPGRQTCYCAKGVSNGGNHVKIQHADGSITIYFHMRVVAVDVGDKVEQGDFIGWIGTTGYSTGNHVCMEYRKSNDKATAFIDTLIENNAATNRTGTPYGLSLSKTDKQSGIYLKPSTSSTKLGTIPAGENVIVQIVQEGYGFVEYNGVSGWIYLPNTSFVNYVYQLRYYKNGGVGDMETQFKVKDTAVKLSENEYTKAGYQFTGWTAYRPYDKKWLCSDGESFGWYTNGSQPDGWSRKKFADGETIPVKANLIGKSGKQVIKLYACWSEADAVNYTVEYLPEGGEGVMASTSGTRGVADAISSCTFTREGYTFAGWTAQRKSDGKWLYKAADGTGSSDYYTPGEQPEGHILFVYADKATMTSPTTVNGDVIYLHAQWTESYITLEPENGQAALRHGVQPGEALGQLPIPTREGYHFLGWFTTAEGGTQLTSLNTTKDLQGEKILYAHWISVEQRPMREEYISRTGEGNTYILSLSQLLSAAGQQADAGYTYAQCREDLDSVGMLTTSGTVKNGYFISTGFLEYFAPELTYYGESYTCDSQDEYVTQLAARMEEGYYILIRLELSDGTKVWRYLYEADGEQLVVIHEGELVTVEELGVQVVSSNLFLYHGSPRPMQWPHMEGSYTRNETGMQVQLAYLGSNLTPGATYQFWIAFYGEDNRLLNCICREEKLTADLTLSLEETCPQEEFICRVYVLDKDFAPLCDVLEPIELKIL